MKNYENHGKMKTNDDAVFGSHGEGRRLVKEGWPKGSAMDNVPKGSGMLPASGVNIAGNVANSGSGTEQ